MFLLTFADCRCHIARRYPLYSVMYRHIKIVSVRRLEFREK